MEEGRKMLKVVKRDGRLVNYDISKIVKAIEKAMISAGRRDVGESKKLAERVEELVSKNFTDTNPTVEDIQDTVEAVLMAAGYAYVAKKYILYRAERTKAR